MNATPVIPSDESDPLGIDEIFAATWLEVTGGYNYGALTAYLLRRFGPPNAKVYSHEKHGATWRVPTIHESLWLDIEPAQS